MEFILSYFYLVYLLEILHLAKERRVFFFKTESFCSDCDKWACFKLSYRILDDSSYPLYTPRALINAFKNSLHVIGQ